MIFTNIDTLKSKLEVSTCASGLAVAAGVMLIGSFLLALACVLPRLSLIPSAILLRLKLHSQPVHSEAVSSLYFDHIANMSRSDYVARVNEMLASENNVVAQIAQQIWMNSRIAAVKYRLIKWSILALVISILLGVISLLLIYG